MKAITKFFQKFRRPQPLFEAIAGAKDPDVRNLAIHIISFRVLMEAYGNDPSYHQSYCELLNCIDNLRSGVVLHHRHRCRCGGPVDAEVELSLNADARLF